MEIRELKLQIKANLESVEAETGRLLEALRSLDQVNSLALEYGEPKASDIPVSDYAGSDNGDLNLASLVEQVAAASLSQELTSEPEEAASADMEYEKAVEEGEQQDTADSPTAMDVLRSRLAEKHSTRRGRFGLSLAN